MKQAQKGFTLIEIMIVVVIIGIIAAVAFPQYEQYVREARRTAAMGCLMEQAHFMERFYSANMTYAGANPNPTCIQENEITQFYAFGVANLGAATYTLNANPIGVQAADRCGNLSVNEAGNRLAAGGANCWR